MIYKENLIVNIDINNSKCKDSNFNVVSLNKWRYSKSKNQIIYDYGLTSFDVGHTNKMHDFLELETKKQNLFLKRVGYNEVNNPNEKELRPYDATTKYDGYEIEEVSDVYGTYYKLNGGYLQGFFKLHDYLYDILPTRYKNGITIENLLYIEENSFGLFFTFGVRAEDKYNPHYFGETEIDNNQVIEKKVTTNEGKPLSSLAESWEYNIAFRRFESELTYDVNIQPDNWDNIKNNIIGFGLTENKKIYYQYISNNSLKINYSPNSIIQTGHTLISIVYLPNYSIDDSDLKCYETRMGCLCFYVDGSLFWEINDFPEPRFREIVNDKTKQIGVPYSFSWGGGTFGLKHSYHYDDLVRYLYENEDNDYINTHFLLDNNNYSLENNFFDNKEVLSLSYSGTEPTNTVFVLFDNPIKVLPNRNYISKINIFNDGFLKLNKNNKIKILIYNGEEVEIINQDELIDYNNWFEIKTEFKLKNTHLDKEIYLGVYIEGDDVFDLTKSIYFSDFIYSGPDILIKDPIKEKLYIERNFDNSFIGGVQKLRVYDEALSSLKILNNAKNEYLTNRIKRGGRIIYDSTLIKSPEPLPITTPEPGVTTTTTTPEPGVTTTTTTPEPGVTTTTTTPEPIEQPIYLGYLRINQGDIITSEIASGVLYPTQVIILDPQENHDDFPERVYCKWKNIFTGMYEFLDYVQFLAIDKSYVETPYFYYKNMDFPGSSGLFTNKGVVESLVINNVDYWIFKLNPTAPINYELL